MKTIFSTLSKKITASLVLLGVLGTSSVVYGSTQLYGDADPNFGGGNSMSANYELVDRLLLWPDTNMSDSYVLQDGGPGIFPYVPEEEDEVVTPPVEPPVTNPPPGGGGGTPPYPYTGPDGNNGGPYVPEPADPVEPVEPEKPVLVINAPDIILPEYSIDFGNVFGDPDPLIEPVTDVDPPAIDTDGGFLQPEDDVIVDGGTDWDQYTERTGVTVKIVDYFPGQQVVEEDNVHVVGLCRFDVRDPRWLAARLCPFELRGVAYENPQIEILQHELEDMWWLLIYVGIVSLLVLIWYFWFVLLYYYRRVHDEV